MRASRTAVVSNCDCRLIDRERLVRNHTAYLRSGLAARSRDGIDVLNCMGGDVPGSSSSSCWWDHRASADLLHPYPGNPRKSRPVEVRCAEVLLRCRPRRCLRQLDRRL